MRFAPGLAPLRHRDFALYFTGLTVSQCGSWMEQTLTTWLLYEITGSPVLLGIGGAMRAIPTFAFGLLAGAIADRVDRRRLLLFTQAGSALTSLGLGLVVATGQVEVWHIYLASVINGTLQTFDAPARRAMYTTMVPRSQMQNAITLNAAVFRIARLIGPSLAGILIAATGPALPYFINAVSFLAIIGALVLISKPPIVDRVRGSLVAETIDGARYTLGKPILANLLLLESAHSLFGANTALVTIVAKDVLHVGPEGLGLLLSSLGGGALVGTGALVMSGDIERKGRSMMVSGYAYVVAFALFAWSRSFELSAITLALVGLADTWWATMRNSIFQLQADEAYRGRTLSAFLLVGRGMAQTSQLQTGISVEAFGPQIAATAGAAVIAAAIIGVNARNDEVRSFRDPTPVLEGPTDAAVS
ncbi:MAG TPA: MFS transporter [Candidatus Limnocylindria bacterium]